MYINQISAERTSFLEILLFTSPSSPCPKMEKDLLETIAKRKLPIKVTKIDILNSPEIAEEHDIVVCPTLIFRDFMKVHGTSERKELDELVAAYSSLTTSKFQNSHQSTITSIGGINYV
ncbi:MAG: thioredoxin family protein [Promethearchaeota archaeon]